MQAPAFSLDYFPSADVAWSLFRETQRINVQSATPKEPRLGGRQDYFDTRFATYGSQGSSNGPWERDMMPSGPQTPYSTGNTPPVVATPHSSRSHRNSMVNSLSTSPEHSAIKAARRSNSNLSAAFSLSKAFTSLGTSPTSQDRYKAAEADLSTSAPTAPTSSVTWGSTTFYSSNSSNSPDKRRRSQSSRRSSFKTFDGAYDTDSDDDGYGTDDSYYDAGKVFVPNKKPSERKIKVILKSQHLFDSEGHASVPLLPPKQLSKFQAYRDIYADQLGAWGLFIQHAEILKFNGLINYWYNDSPIYPMEAQLLTERSGDNTDKSQQLALYQTQGLFDSETSQSIVNHGLGSNHNSNFTMSGLPIETPSTMPSSHYSLNTPTLQRLDSAATSDMKEKKYQPPPGTRNCYICMERIRGLFVGCPRGEHRAHATCYEGYVDGRSEEEMRGLGVSCGCKPFELEDWKSDLETSWGSIMGKNGKLNVPFTTLGNHGLYNHLNDVHDKTYQNGVHQ